jgi:hypothetical protein
MEVRIGVANTAREIAFESKADQKEVSKAVAAALADGGLLTLPDDKGRQYMIPADKITYVELGESTPRRVGFAGS